MTKKTHVDGEQHGKILIYTLSTCVWCKMTKKFLNELGVAYDYIDVDLLDGEEKEKIMEEVEKWNPNASFPTIVFNGKKALSGFDKDKIREAIGK